MSFGWSAGDIVAAGQLLWSLYKVLDEVTGAPEHHRRSASSLRAIQLRLRLLRDLLGRDENPDPLTETEEAGLLESADNKDIRRIVISLKLAVGKLEALVAKGLNMSLDPNKKRCRDWPMNQIRKLRWYYGKEGEVDGLIQHILELTAPLLDIRQMINLELLKQQDVTQGVYHETTLSYLKPILAKVTLIEKALGEAQLLEMNEEAKASRVPLLHAGPDLGVPPTEVALGLDKGSAMSHLGGVAPEITSLGLRVEVKNLRADHHLKHKFEEWLGGKTSPRLWLHGNRADMVSAIVYAAALDRRRPTIAFAGRHADAGQLLTDEERLLRMVYSILFQLLHQFEGISSFVVTEVDEPFTDLRLSVESMQLALNNGAGPVVEETLKNFLDLFERPPANADDGDWGLRLLLTSRGNSQMLQGLGGDYVGSFDLNNHVDAGRMKLYTTLLGIEW